MVSAAVIWVEFTTVTLLTAIHGLLTATLAPVTKFVPVSVTGTVAPCTPLVGLTDARVGADELMASGTLAEMSELTDVSATQRACAVSE